MTQQEFNEMVTRVMNLLDRSAACAADFAPFNDDMALLAGNIQLLIGAFQHGDMVELSNHVEKFLDKKLAERRVADRRAGLAVEDLIKSIGGINLN